MRIRFWGTRGSIAKAGPSTVRFGGNTSCVEVRSSDGTLLVLDCGTGAHGLGQALMAEEPKPIKGHILIGHTHWDHIQGFPFFTPLFVPGNEWDIYAPWGLGQNLQDTLAGQMQYTYFPVSLHQLGATIRYHDLVEGTFQIGGITVTAQYLNHPALTLGYRLQADGATVVYATDHEPYSHTLATAAEPTKGQDAEPAHRGDMLHSQFLTNADLVIHDAQYLASEYSAKVGWGHSTVEYVVDMAQTAGVKSLGLFHHDPTRDDGLVDQVVEIARARAQAHGKALEVFAAAEGQVIEFGLMALSPTGELPLKVPTPDGVARPSVELSALVAGVGPLAETLVRALETDQIRTLCATSGEEAQRIALDAHPTLVLLDAALGGRSAGAVCRQLRDRRDDALDVTVVMVLPREDGGAVMAALEAGATDCLIAPFSQEFARTRIRAWLLRTRCRWAPASLPPDENQRLEAVRRLRLLDTPPDERFDRLARIAERVFDVTMAGISLIDEDRQWFKTSNKLGILAIPRDISICAHVILTGESIMLTDGLANQRFGDNPFFTERAMRFFATIPLTGPGGHLIGSLCLIDGRPHQFDDRDVATLRDLAKLAEDLLTTESALVS